MIMPYLIYFVCEFSLLNIVMNCAKPILRVFFVNISLLTEKLYSSSVMLSVCGNKKGSPKGAFLKYVWYLLIYRRLMERLVR